MTFDLDLKALWIEKLVATADRIFRTRKANFPSDTNIAFLNIVETGGLEPNQTHNGDPYEFPSAQCVARHRNSDTAKALAYAAWNACWSVKNRTVNGTRYLNMKPQQSPFEIDPDDVERARWAFNVIGRKAG